LPSSFYNMGCMSSVPDYETQERADEEAVTNFLQAGNIDTLWHQFDSNNDGCIDATEFNNLVYVSLKYFCTERNPNAPPPSFEAMAPFIEKLVTQLRPYVDKDQDMQITKKEFESYGSYLTAEFSKLQKELKVRKLN